MLHMAYKYAPPSGGAADGDESACTEAFLANANRGGENVATGALMGALVGASCGFSGLSRALRQGLAPGHESDLEKDVDAFVISSPFAAALSASPKEGCGEEGKEKDGM